MKRIFMVMWTGIYFTKPQAATNFTNANRMADFHRGSLIRVIRRTEGASCHTYSRRMGKNSFNSRNSLLKKAVGNSRNLNYLYINNVYKFCKWLSLLHIYHERTPVSCANGHSCPAQIHTRVHLALSPVSTSVSHSLYSLKWCLPELRDNDCQNREITTARCVKTWKGEEGWSERLIAIKFNAVWFSIFGACVFMIRKLAFCWRRNGG